MKTKFISLSLAVLMGVLVWADDVWNYNVYDDCSKNGYEAGISPAPADVQAVDLGLPSGIKWASCNVGANKPEDSGNYYAWGEVFPKTDYSWATYRYANGNYDKLTKYCNNASLGNDGFTDNKTTLEPEDDAAHVNWGGNWRMPTADEWDELIRYCYHSLTTQNGVKGYSIRGKKNGNCIFLPAVEYYDGTSLYFYIGSMGSYWSSSLYNYNGYYNNTTAHRLYFDSSNGVERLYFNAARCKGMPIRPVCLSSASNYLTLTLYADDCKNANVIKCNVGRQVNVTAVPDAHRHFVRWADGNTENPRLITMTQDMTLLAEFATDFHGQCGANLCWKYEGHTLSITGSDDMYDYDWNSNRPWFLFRDTTNIVLLPHGITHIGNNAFNNFVRLSEIELPNTLTSIGASAFSGCIGLTSVAIGNGIINIGDNAFSGCKNVETVVFGSAVETIGESAFAGCQSIYEMTIYATKVPTIQENTFTEVGTGATLRVPAGCAKKYKAHPYWGVFNIEEIPSEYIITVTCDPKQGQVSGSGTFTDGSEVTITATPNEGYEFTQWSDGNKDNPRKVTVTADATYTAEFALQNYVVSVTCDPQQVQVTGGGTYPYGSEVTLTATPNEGYAFTQWSDGNKDNPRKVTVTADATYTAEFALQNYVVSATCDPQQGQVTGGGTYPYGSEVTLTATPNEGYAFTQWSDGNKDNPRKVTVTNDATYTAEFALQTYVVSVTCDPQQGQVTGGGTYLYGSEVTLTAVPNDGYTFKQWSDGTLANPYSFPAEKDVNIEALFEPTTPVENVAAEENDAPRKVFRNGQVYILRNGKTYTLTGVEVK